MRVGERSALPLVCTHTCFSWHILDSQAAWLPAKSGKLAQTLLRPPTFEHPHRCPSRRREIWPGSGNGVGGRTRMPVAALHRHRPVYRRTGRTIHRPVNLKGSCTVRNQPQRHWVSRSDLVLWPFTAEMASSAFWGIPAVMAIPYSYEVTGPNCF